MLVTFAQKQLGYNGNLFCVPLLFLFYLRSN